MNLTSTADSSINGIINCPGDKSISQRALMIAALMNQEMTIDGFLHAEDPLSTMKALNDIGAQITINEDNSVQVHKRKKIFTQPLNPLYLGNSGTGLRLLLGLTSGIGLNLSFCGDSSLAKRPMSRVIYPLSQMGASIESSDGMLPITINPSSLKSNFVYELPVASAQVKSSILLAGLASGVSVTVIEPIQTRDHTERMLKSFGANIMIVSKNNKNIITLAENSLLNASDYKVVGDISSAAFLIVGALISGSTGLEILNVGMNPTRIGVLYVLQKMGANIEIHNQRVQSGEPCADLIIYPSKLKGIKLDGSIIPNIIDEIPIISIAAAFADGDTIIGDAAELRVKESDRLHAVSTGFKKLGVMHENFDDGMKIYGKSGMLSLPKSISLESYDDHRIAMSFLIAGMRCSKPIIVKDCNNIFTSFPNFIELTSSIGYKIEK